jgi:hypothetical protein
MKHCHVYPLAGKFFRLNTWQAHHALDPSVIRHIVQYLEDEKFFASGPDTHVPGKIPGHAKGGLATCGDLHKTLQRKMKEYMLYVPQC